MTAFKSFDQFVNENFSNQTGYNGTLIQEKETDYSAELGNLTFKVNKRSDKEDGDVDAFYVILKAKKAGDTEDEVRNSIIPEIAQQIATSSEAKDIQQYLNNATYVLTFEAEKVKTKGGVFGMFKGKPVVKGTLRVKKASDYDVTKMDQDKAALYAEKPFKMYSAAEVEKYKAGAVTPAASSGTSGSTGTSGTGGTSGTSGAPTTSAYEQIKALTPKAEILKFLQDKLLSGGGTGKIKKGDKSKEVKFAQLIILEKIFATKLGDGAKNVQSNLGNADGDYGTRTSKAFGSMLDNKVDVEHQAISADDVTLLAKYCTFANIDVPKTAESEGLQALWDKSDLGTKSTSGTSSTSSTSSTAGTSGTAGTGGASTEFIYINKP